VFHFLGTPPLAPTLAITTSDGVNGTYRADVVETGRPAAYDSVHAWHLYSAVIGADNPDTNPSIWTEIGEPDADSQNDAEWVGQPIVKNYIARYWTGTLFSLWSDIL
jgi:hypothetical protein